MSEFQAIRQSIMSQLERLQGELWKLSEEAVQKQDIEKADRVNSLIKEALSITNNMNHVFKKIQEGLAVPVIPPRNEIVVSVQNNKPVTKGLARRRREFIVGTICQ